nr:MAG TPA: hypothetical protein [Caudoviricetes sp.]
MTTLEKFFDLKTELIEDGMYNEDSIPYRIWDFIFTSKNTGQWRNINYGQNDIVTVDSLRPLLEIEFLTENQLIQIATNTQTKLEGLR